MSDACEPGEAGEPAPLTDPEEMLFRQVHPTFFDGEPTSQAFRPNSGDDGKMSVDRGTKTTAREAFVRYRQVHDSIGTWGLTVGEIGGVELNAVPDCLPENDAHTFVDFRELSPSQCKSKSKELRRMAVERSCLYRPAQS